mmetsp:Transcript_5500/g.10463  ORF Transcript_5500/g.10463 Transcript_5500/m.10463 type:complete len:332 (-) Transcript_5500:175-1170(-)
MKKKKSYKKTPKADPHKTHGHYRKPKPVLPTLPDNKPINHRLTCCSTYLTLLKTHPNWPLLSTPHYSYKNLDLRHAPRSWRDSHQVKLPELLVVARHFALPLQHLDLHLALVVGRRGKYLFLFGRDGGVAVDQGGEHAPQGLDAEAEWGHVQEQHVLDVAPEHSPLNGGAHGHHLVRVHAPARLPPEEGLHLVLDLGHARHAPHQDHLVDVALLHPRVLDALLAGPHGALHQLLHDGLELRLGHLDVEVLGSRGVGGDEGQAHVGGAQPVQLALRFFRGFAQALHCQFVSRQVYAAVFFELREQVFEQLLVEVLPAQHGVAVGGLHLEHAP